MSSSRVALVEFDAVAHRIKSNNPWLYKAITTIPRGQRPPLVSASYRFGDRIVSRGQLLLPSSHAKKLVNLQSFENPLIQKELVYSSIPVGLVLDKLCEVYVDVNQRVVPLNCIDGGRCFGLFESLSSPSRLPPIWSVSAGARSLFMLPKIADAKHYANLIKTYHLNQAMPASLSQQIFVFKELAERAASQWSVDVLFFTKGWFDQSSPDWLCFRNCLLEQGWEQMRYIRSNHAYTFVWEQLMEAVSLSKLKPSAYQIETIQHLISMHLGAFPGFVPAELGDNTAGPIELLQQIYVNDYGLKENLPIMMHPALRRQDKHQRLYYSLSHPSMPSGKHLQNPRGIIKEIQTIRQIMRLFEDILSQYNHVDQLASILPSLEYFHLNEADGVRPFRELPDVDPSFMLVQSMYPTHHFPAFSPFARGCIQVNA